MLGRGHRLPAQPARHRGDRRPRRWTARRGPAARRRGRAVSALAFKIQTDQHLGKLTYIRVYSGKLDAGSQVLNSTKDRKEMVGKIYQMHANKREERGKGAGEIVAVTA